MSCWTHITGIIKVIPDGDTYCVSCGNPMTSEMGSMICPECQKYLKENTDLQSKNISHFK